MYSIGVRHVVIEASGVASPAKIAGYGRDWPGFRARGSVVVINAVTLRDRLADRYVGSLVARQIKEASALVVHSNCEALDTVALAAGRACWHASDPDVLELLFDDRHDLVQQRHCTTAAIPQFATVTLRQRQAMDRGALDAWLGGLPAGIARVKGFVATPAETLLVQRVADHLEITPAPGCATPTLVLIAPREVFSPAALACLAPPGWTAAAR
jgi:G3E family GTPase